MPRSLQKAEQMLTVPKAERTDRMLVIMLSGRHERMCCVFKTLLKTTSPRTPADLFVFSIDNSAQAAVQREFPTG